jgi:putative oxidoreductase
MLQARAVSLLLARVAIGVIFIVHGWQKFGDVGLDATARFFASSGVPLAGIAAPGQAILEIVGGIALVVGALLPIFGSLLALSMVGAIVFVHGANGFSMANNGYEYVLALAAASLVIAFSGGGALAVDSLWNNRQQAAVRAEA